MGLAMFGLHERGPTLKPNVDEVGVPPARPYPPCGATASIGVHVVGMEVLTL